MAQLGSREVAGIPARKQLPHCPGPKSPGPLPLAVCVLHPLFPLQPQSPAHRPPPATPRLQASVLFPPILAKPMPQKEQGFPFNPGSCWHTQDPGQVLPHTPGHPGLQRLLCMSALAQQVGHPTPRTPANPPAPSCPLPPQPEVSLLRGYSAFGVFLLLPSYTPSDWTTKPES